MEIGYFSGDCSSTRGVRKSPQTLMKVNSAQAPTPGLVSGKTIRIAPRIREHPSIHDASSSSIGIESMKFLISYSVNGSW